MTHSYNITGITCGSCEKKVKDALTKIADITNIEIDRTTGITNIHMNKHVSTEALKSALLEYPKYQLSEIVHTPAALPFTDVEAKSWLVTYKPLLFIFGYISMVSVIVGNTAGVFNTWEAMRIFMAGFFLVFSFFKFLDLDGFADSYSMYDIVAKKVKAWGYIYPFVELVLGVAFATGFWPVTTNMATFLVMSVSIIGVLQSVFSKRKIKCACLGAVFNLPMSTVTIIEDALMITMSAWMLLMML